jgi:hypothetical protein
MSGALEFRSQEIHHLLSPLVQPPQGALGVARVGV